MDSPQICAARDYPPGPPRLECGAVVPGRLLSPGAVDRGRLRIVMGTILFNVIAVALLTFAPWSDWRSGLAIDLIDTGAFALFAWRMRDRLMARLIVYGMVLGLVELIADAWLVDQTRTLDYSMGGGPMLWRSPVWMPLAWEVVAVQFGVLGLSLMRWRPVKGLLLTGLLGGVNIPYYEEMARRIHWWSYSNCRLVSGTPFYVILGEIGIAIGFAWGARLVAAGRMRAVISVGVLGGLWIWVCYMAAFAVTECF